MPAQPQRPIAAGLGYCSTGWLRHIHSALCQIQVQHAEGLVEWACMGKAGQLLSMAEGPGKLRAGEAAAAWTSLFVVNCQGARPALKVDGCVDGRSWKCNAVFIAEGATGERWQHRKYLTAPHLHVSYSAATVTQTPARASPSPSVQLLLPRFVQTPRCPGAES